jgi:hypothetical protein
MLLRDHRFWPLFNGGVALFGALGLTTLIDLPSRSRTLRGTPARILSGVLVVVVAALALPSPVLAGIAYPEKLKPPRILSSTLTGSDTWLAALDRGSTEDRYVAVPHAAQHLVSAYTGYRELVFFSAKKNFGHQRYRDILGSLGGTEPRVRANKILTTGDASPQVWRRLASKWRIERVLVPRAFLTARGFQGCRPIESSPYSEFAIVLVDACR